MIKEESGSIHSAMLLPRLTLVLSKKIVFPDPVLLNMTVCKEYFNIIARGRISPKQWHFFPELEWVRPQERMPIQWGLVIRTWIPARLRRQCNSRPQGKTSGPGTHTYGQPFPLTLNDVIIPSCTHTQLVRSNHFVLGTLLPIHHLSWRRKQERQQKVRSRR